MMVVAVFPQTSGFEIDPLAMRDELCIRDMLGDHELRERCTRTCIHHDGMSDLLSGRFHVCVPIASAICECTKRQARKSAGITIVSGNARNWVSSALFLNRRLPAERAALVVRAVVVGVLAPVPIDLPLRRDTRSAFATRETAAEGEVQRCLWSRAIVSA